MQSQEENPADEITVKKLVTFDDCAVYGIEGVGRSLYVTRCGRGVVQSAWGDRHCQMVGKTMMCREVPRESQTVEHRDSPVLSILSASVPVVQTPHLRTTSVVTGGGTSTRTPSRRPSTTGG